MDSGPGTGFTNSRRTVAGADEARRMLRELLRTVREAMLTFT
jgi:hypothetical protein